MREEPPIRGCLGGLRARPRLPEVQGKRDPMRVPAFGNLPREGPGGSQKDGLCDTPVLLNVAHIPTIPPPGFD